MESFGTEDKPEVWNKGIQSALVCYVFKSLCVFSLFIPERIPLLLLKEQTWLWLCRLLLFDPSPSPKPPFDAGGDCSEPAGLLGRQPAASSLCCLTVSHSNLLHWPAELSFPDLPG